MTSLSELGEISKVHAHTFNWEPPKFDIPQFNFEMPPEAYEHISPPRAGPTNKQAAIAAGGLAALGGGAYLMSRRNKKQQAEQARRQGNGMRRMQ